VRVGLLPGVAELGHRGGLALGNEDRVVAEAFASARLVANPAVEGSAATQLVALIGDGDQLAEVAGATAFTFDPGKLRE
jgi:hypothetical protein